VDDGGVKCRWGVWMVGLVVWGAGGPRVDDWKLLFLVCFIVDSFGKRFVFVCEDCVGVVIKFCLCT